jgi:DeoR family transcriptional regulator of aga operon
LGRLSADIFFLAVDGFDVHYGPTTPNLLEAKVNREMIKISRRIVCVCDSSKFGRRSLSQITALSSIHQVITDSKIPKADLNELTEAGIKVTTV